MNVQPVLPEIRSVNAVRLDETVLFGQVFLGKGLEEEPTARKSGDVRPQDTEDSERGATHRHAGFAVRELLADEFILPLLDAGGGAGDAGDDERHGVGLCGGLVMWCLLGCCLTDWADG